MLSAVMLNVVAPNIKLNVAILMSVVIPCVITSSVAAPGSPDWAIFHQLDYFWRVIMIFREDEVAQNNGNFWGYFLFKQIYYIFT
jgi:hypothetical protein